MENEDRLFSHQPKGHFVDVCLLDGGGVSNVVSGGSHVARASPVFCECGNSDPSRLGTDCDTGAPVCEQCGICLPSAVFGLPRGEEDQERPRPTLAERRAQSRRRGKDTYRRAAHIRERVIQYCLREPLVGNKPFNRIRDWFNQMVAAGEITPRRHSTSIGLHDVHSIDRADVHTALRSMNAARVDGRTDWTRRYLERWKQIRQRLYPGESETVYTDDEAVWVLAVFTRLSNRWDQYQPPRHPDRRLFPDRKHFPSYNLVFRLVMQQLAVPYEPRDWPVPKSSPGLYHYIEMLMPALEELCEPGTELDSARVFWEAVKVGWPLGRSLFLSCHFIFTNYR